ncbi:hypothetical protein N9480_02325, partial [Planktomarina temperata]|nr:hypothetical protein [Planktomarina temperata]
MKMTKIELASVELLDTKASIAASSKNKRAAKLKKAANAGGLSSLTLLVAACGGGSSDTPAPQSTLLTLTKSGDTYSASAVTGFALTDSSSAKFAVTDDTADNAYSIKLTANGTGTLEFDFADADDTVTLEAGSAVTGFTTLKVTDGTVDATSADLSSITRVEVASGAVLSLAQVKEIPTLISNSSTGTITIEVASSDEADELVALLTAGTVSVYGESSNVTVAASSDADETLTTEVISTKQTAVVAEVKDVSEAPADSGDSGSGEDSGESGSGDDDSGDSGSGDDSGDGGSSGGGGGGGGGGSDVLSLTLVTTGNYQLGSDNGAVTLTESGSQLILTPATGGGTTVTKSSVDSLATSVDITATAAVASGMTVTGTGAFAVTALDATAAADLSNITVTGARTAAVSDDVTFTGDLGTFTTTVAAGKTLTADVAKLQGEIINGAGTVAITDLDTDLDADLSTITSTTVTATFNESGTFTGNLGTATTTVAATKTMTAAASVVTAEKIAGTGNLSITGMTNTTDVSNFTLTGTYTLAGVTTAANLNALDVLSGSAVAAAGITTITGAATDVVNATNDQATIDTATNVNVTLSDTTVVASTVDTINSANGSGGIDISLGTTINGSAANLVKIVQNTGSSFTTATNYIVTIDDADAADINATDLSAIGADTSGVVTVTNAIDINGTTAEATAALVTADTLVVVSDATVTLTGTGAVADIDAIANKTTGIVTGGVTAGTAAALNTALANAVSTDALTITTTAGSAAATDLTGLDGKSSVAIVASANTTI